VSGRATFEAEYTFNTPGVRRVRAVGFDAGGAQVAEDLVELTVR